jgi:hypothetical protein
LYASWDGCIEICHFVTIRAEKTIEGKCVGACVMNAKMRIMLIFCSRFVGFVQDLLLLKVSIIVLYLCRGQI